jgi:hypothetical protein
LIHLLHGKGQFADADTADLITWGGNVPKTIFGALLIQSSKKMFNYFWQGATTQKYTYHHTQRTTEYGIVVTSLPQLASISSCSANE